MNRKWKKKFYFFSKETKKIHQGIEKNSYLWEERGHTYWPSICNSNEIVIKINFKKSAKLFIVLNGYFLSLEILFCVFYCISHFNQYNFFYEHAWFLSNFFSCFLSESQLKALLFNLIKVKNIWIWRCKFQNLLLEKFEQILQAFFRDIFPDSRGISRSFVISHDSVFIWQISLWSFSNDFFLLNCLFWKFFQKFLSILFSFQKIFSFFPTWKTEKNQLKKILTKIFQGKEKFGWFHSKPWFGFFFVFGKEKKIWQLRKRFRKKS